MKKRVRDALFRLPHSALPKCVSARHWGVPPGLRDAARREMMPADAKSITQELNKICEAPAVADGRAGSNRIDADRLTHLEIYATVQRTLMEAAVRMGGRDKALRRVRRRI